MKVTVDSEKIGNLVYDLLMNDVGFDEPKAYGLSERVEEILVKNEEPIIRETDYETLYVIEKAKNEIYKNHWLMLCDSILAEIQRDGWCRLTMTKEKALEMKELFESFDRKEESL